MAPTALITGASKGLGETTATFLARSGYDVIITARTATELEAAAKRLSGLGGRVIPIAGDITDADHRADLARAVADLGGLDVLVNNASYLGPSPLVPLMELSVTDIGNLFRTNAGAPLTLIQTLRPHLEGGLVVNITSDAGVNAYEGWGGYGASKAALEHLTRTLAVELRDARISVVVVDPGDMRTQMHQDAFVGEDISDRPTPDVTVPFWAWLFSVDPLSVTGQRFEAQGERWEQAS